MKLVDRLLDRLLGQTVRPPQKKKEPWVVSPEEPPARPEDFRETRSPRKTMDTESFGKLSVEAAAVLLWKLALKHPQASELIRRTAAMHEQEVDRLLSKLLHELDRLHILR